MKNSYRALTARSSKGWICLLAVTSLALIGCRQDMHNQAKYEPYEKSDFFLDGSSARVPPAFTVPRGALDPASPILTGEDASGWMTAVPYVVDAAFLHRGQQRFDIYCSPCHDNTGDGNGMIVQRGFKQPPSYHEQRLRDMPIGYFYNVATNGYGLMSGYQAQVDLQDRWAIAAWVRVLQRSQNVPESSLSATDREQLKHDAENAEFSTASAHAAGAS